MNDSENTEKMNDTNMIPVDANGNFDEFEDFDTGYLSDNNTPNQLPLFQDQLDSINSDSDTESVDEIHTQEIDCLIEVINNFDPESISNEDNKDIIISYENLKDRAVEMLVEFARLFKIKIVHNNENATHLIVRTLNKINFYRTVLVADALIKNIPIVSLKWVIECLISKTLVRVESFMPIDITGEVSPFMSWSVGMNYADPKFEWTKKIILYIHRSVESHQAHSYIPNWARKLGFLIADNFEDFRNDDLDLRIVLVGHEKINDRMWPSKMEIIDWARDNQALTVYVDWLTDCIFNYKFVEISSWHMPVQLPKKLAYCSGLLGYYKIEDE